MTRRMGGVIWIHQKIKIKGEQDNQANMPKIEKV